MIVNNKIRNNQVAMQMADQRRLEDIEKLLEIGNNNLSHYQFQDLLNELIGVETEDGVEDLFLNLMLRLTEDLDRVSRHILCI